MLTKLALPCPIR